MDTDGLAQAIASQQERMLRDLLDRAQSSIVEYRQIIREKDEVIRQYAEKAREDAITIARLRVGRENDAALQRAVAQRDAREYAAAMQRSSAGAHHVSATAQTQAAESAAEYQR